MVISYVMQASAKIGTTLCWNICNALPWPPKGLIKTNICFWVGRVILDRSEMSKVNHNRLVNIQQNDSIKCLYVYQQYKIAIV